MESFTFELLLALLAYFHHQSEDNKINCSSSKKKFEKGRVAEREQNNLETVVRPTKKHSKILQSIYHSPFQRFNKSKSFVIATKTATQCGLRLTFCVTSYIIHEMLTGRFQ